jgi:putative transposase
VPVKNVVKTYVKDGFYHVYNRGVEKRKIFLDDQDYRVFLNILKVALLSPSELKNTKKNVSFKGVTFKGVMKMPKNFFRKIDLLAYCLMPNHFHLLLTQLEERSMHQFLQSICTRYVIYFNKKHKRIGALFQNAYKASLITDEPYLFHLSRYIHRNSRKHTKRLVDWYSSYGEYLGIRKTEWVKPEMILSFFQKGELPFLKHTNSYKSFVEYENDELDRLLDSSWTLEEPE